MLLSLIACQTDDTAKGAGAVDGTVVVADLRGNEWAIADLSEPAVTSAYSLSTIEPGVCEGEENEVYCLLFEASVRQAADGEAEVDFTWSELDVSDGDDDGANDLLSRVAAVGLEDRAVRWSFRYLDFSAVASDCPFDPEDPCHPASSLPAGDIWTCSMHMAHTVAVTDESDDTVAMWVVDSRNSRLLHVTLEKGDDCAVVDTIVDRAQHTDWDLYNSVNSIDRREVDGETLLLMSVKGSFPDEATGLAQQGGESRGKILLWSESPSPAQRWEFPPASDSVANFLNTPHGVQWLERPDGERWVVFAHSLGNSEKDWGLGSGGSVGVFRVTDAGPEYLYDAVLHPDQGSLRFPRDVTPMPDGRVLVTDSGCLGDDCDYETAVWLLELPDAEPSGKSGAWTPDHENQERVTVVAQGGPWLEEMNLLYSTNWVSE